MPFVEEADSRQYRFAFLADCWDQLPGDFGVPQAARGFRSALFLPRHESGWFGRSLYPPRLIFLYPDAIEIRAHRFCEEEPTRIPLRELQFVEVGRILLSGWLRFAGERSDRRLLYNTVSSRPVDGFLASLREAYVPAQAAGEYHRAPFREPLDLKFRNACRQELDLGEEMLIQFFHAARRTMRRIGPFRRESWSAADLLAITDRRVLWITDRHYGRYQPYGRIASFAPLASVSECACIRNEAGLSLVVTLRGSAAWQIPVPSELEDEARSFAQAAENRVRKTLWKPPAR